MLTRTIKMVLLHRRGGMENDSWGVPVNFPTPSNCRGVGKPNKDTQPRLWEAVSVCNRLNIQILWGRSVFLLVGFQSQDRKGPVPKTAAGAVPHSHSKLGTETVVRPCLSAPRRQVVAVLYSDFAGTMALALACHPATAATGIGLGLGGARRICSKNGHGGVIHHRIHGPWPWSQRC